MQRIRLLLAVCYFGGAQAGRKALESLANLETETEQTQGNCMFPCGAESVTVQAPDGENSITFAVGKGRGVGYQNRRSKCLSACQVIGSKQKCANVKTGNSGTKPFKIAKTKFDNQDVKLCCVPKTCAYNPADDSYTMHKRGQWQSRKDRYLPLQVVPNYVRFRSCLCCDASASAINWGPQVQKKCKLAYRKGLLQNMGNAVTRAATLTLADHVRKTRCRSYCAKYAGHSHFKFVDRDRDLRNTEAIAVADPVETAGAPPASQNPFGSDAPASAAASKWKEMQKQQQK